MKIDLGRFREAFFQEAQDHVNNMEAALLTLDSDAADSEALNTIFRAAHSIKGASGTFAFEDVTRFTHTLENLLDRMRQGKVSPSPARVQLLLSSCDGLRQLLAAAQSEARPPAEIEQLLIQLTVAQRAGEFVLDAAHKLREQDCRGPARWSISFVPSPDVFREGLDPLLLLRDLSELGTVDQVCCDIDRLPALGKMQPSTSYLGWSIRLTTDKDQAAIQDVFAFAADGAQITIERLQTEPRPAPQIVASPTPSVRRSAAEHPPSHDSSGSIRVATGKVDQLVNLIGELVIAHSMTVDIARHFSSERLPELQAALEEVTRNTRELQDRIMAVRMLPVGTVFARLQRIVHDVAAGTGKSIRIEMSGEDTELDKTVLEGMLDPLIHIIRNAADHGIEPTGVRRAAGKPEQGTISVRARHEGGNFYVEVADDGRGLDMQRIHAKAIERGLIGPAEELSPEQLQALIFHPGFSTAEKISEVSGRGVGMDVVRRNVETLGGVVSLRSRTGQGTTVIVKLPLTLAILEGQLVRVGKAVYVLPLISILESIRPRREHLRAMAGQGEVVVVRQDPLPLLRLHELFGVSSDVVEPWRGIVVVIEQEARRYALLVDELLNQQQVVIKSLQSNFRKVAGTMGATILGNGQVALILDVAGLVELSRKIPGIAAVSAQEPSSEAAASC